MKAIEAAARALHEEWPRLGILSRAVVHGHPSKTEIAGVALDAACSPELDLERLVRLGDVLASVRRLQWEETIARHTIGAVADHIEREFLGDQTQEPEWTAPDPLNVAVLFTGTASMWERRYAEATRKET